MLCFFVKGLKLFKWIEIHTEVGVLSEYKDFLNDTKKQLSFMVIFIKIMMVAFII